MGSLRNIKRQNYIPPKDREWEESERRKHALEIINKIQFLFAGSNYPKDHKDFELSASNFLRDGMFSDKAKEVRNRILRNYEITIAYSDKFVMEDFQDVRAEILYQFRKTMKRWGPLPAKRRNP